MRLGRLRRFRALARQFFLQRAHLEVERMILRLGGLKLVIHLPVVVLQLGDDLALGLPGQVRAAPALDGEESHSLRLRIILQTLNLRRQGLTRARNASVSETSAVTISKELGRASKNVRARGSGSGGARADMDLSARSNEKCDVGCTSTKAPVWACGGGRMWRLEIRLAPG